MAKEESDLKHIRARSEELANLPYEELTDKLEDHQSIIEEKVEKMSRRSKRVITRTSPRRTGNVVGAGSGPLDTVEQRGATCATTRVITQVARRLAENLYREGHTYLKAGVGLIDLVDRNHYQQDLFHPGQSGKTDRLMQAIDAINQVKGKGSVFLAAQGVSWPWYMRQQFTSPEYTTRWSDIPVVRA